MIINNKAPEPRYETNYIDNDKLKENGAFDAMF